LALGKRLDAERWLAIAVGSAGVLLVWLGLDQVPDLAVVLGALVGVSGLFLLWRACQGTR
jgi:drug/metabolite transporter (DMT)-like permease